MLGPPASLQAVLGRQGASKQAVVGLQSFLCESRRWGDSSGKDAAGLLSPGALLSSTLPGEGCRHPLGGSSGHGRDLRLPRRGSGWQTLPSLVILCRCSERWD